MTATTIRFQPWAPAFRSKQCGCLLFRYWHNTGMQSRSQQPRQDVIKLSEREAALCKPEQCLSLETAPMCELGQPRAASEIIPTEKPGRGRPYCKEQ